jgi:tetratricopeptide (TPR) repeat protein
MLLIKVFVFCDSLVLTGCKGFGVRLCNPASGQLQFGMKKMLSVNPLTDKVQHAVWIALSITALSFPVVATAHGPLHEQIVRLSKEIEQFPDRADLYIQRGELHRHHQDWNAALADYDNANRLEPKLAMADLCRGKLFLDAGEPKQAKAALDRFLTNAPNDAEGFLTRGRALAQMGAHSLAAEDFSSAIQNVETPQPEYYYERSQALVAAGRLMEALHGVDEGIRRLGEIVTLQLCAIDLEIRMQFYDGALARLEKVAAQSPRKEKWLARRGEILLMAGRHEEARRAFRAALLEIETLPSSRRNAKAVVDLEKRVRAALGA